MNRYRSVPPRFPQRSPLPQPKASKLQVFGVAGGLVTIIGLWLLAATASVATSVLVIWAVLHFVFHV